VTFRNHTATLLALATLSGCAMAPAHADAWTPGQHVPDPTNASPRLSAAPPRALPPLSYRYDADGLVISHQDARFAPLPLIRGYRRNGGGLVQDWRGTPVVAAAGGGGRPDTDGDGRGGSCERTDNRPPFCPRPPEPPSPPTPIDPPQPGVPGPLPVLGLGTAFAYSRKLRRRIK
jgi:hypothetical protein